MSKPQNEKPKDFSEEFTKISSHAREEILWVRSVYKLVFSGVIALIAVGIYFTYQNTHDLKADMQKDADTMRASLHADFETLKQQQQQDLNSYLTQMHDAVTKRIDAEFATNEISDLVRDKAKERIDAIADLLIQTNIQEKIAPIRSELLDVLKANTDKEESRIEAMDKSVNESHDTETNFQAVLAEARDALKKLDDQSDFILTVLAAENDDRSAFEKLQRLANDSTYSLHDQALKSTETMQERYVGLASITDNGWRNIGWSDGVKPDTFDINRIEENWATLPPELSRAYVDFVWGHTNITRDQKLTFLHAVLTNSRNSLKAEDKAAHILSDELKAKYNPPFDFSDIELKWSEWTKTNHPPTTTGTNVSSQNH